MSNEKQLELPLPPPLPVPREEESGEKCACCGRKIEGGVILHPTGEVTCLSCNPN